MTVQLNRGKAAAALSLTPLIDVVFLLLIFFLVTARFAQDAQDAQEARQERIVDVVLPSASEAQPLIAEPQEIFINVTSDGAYFLGGDALAKDEVERALREAAVNNPGQQTVFIRADKKVELDYVVFIMNLCNKVGITDYSLTTEGEGG